MNHIIQQIEAERATRKVPEFKPGDTGCERAVSGLRLSSDKMTR